MAFFSSSFAPSFPGCFFSVKAPSWGSGAFCGASVGRGDEENPLGSDFRPASEKKRAKGRKICSLARKNCSFPRKLVRGMEKNQVLIVGARRR